MGGRNGLRPSDWPNQKRVSAGLGKHGLFSFTCSSPDDSLAADASRITAPLFCSHISLQLVDLFSTDHSTRLAHSCCLLTPPTQPTTHPAARAHELPSALLLVVTMANNIDIDFTRRNKKPRPLSELEREKLDEFVDAIHYSARYVAYYIRFFSTVDADYDLGTQIANMSIAMFNYPSKCLRQYPRTTLMAHVGR